MKKISAVEWLVEQLNQKIDFIPLDKWDMIRNIVQEAIAMEKEQIVDANISGMEFIPADPSMYKQDAEQYYNETYKGGQNV